MSNVSKKLVESNIPESLRLNVVHLHNGNSSRNQRKGHSFVTLVKLMDRSTDTVIAEGKAYCSDGDSPRRSIGRQVAIGRALKAYNWQLVSGM